MSLFGYKRSSSGIWGENGVQYATPFSSSLPPLPYQQHEARPGGWGKKTAVVAVCVLVRAPGP